MSRSIVPCIGWLAVCLLAAGCVPVPIAPHNIWMRRNIGATLPVKIVPNQTTMADVLLALGEPDTVTTVGGTTRMVWTAGHSEGGIGGILLAPMAGVAWAGGVMTMEYQRWVIVFDAHGIVLSSRYEERTCKEVSSPVVGTKASEWQPCVGLDWAKGEKE